MAKLEHAPNNFAGVNSTLADKLNDTTRRYPRTLEEAFPQWEASPSIEKPPSRLFEGYSVQDFWEAVIGSFFGGFFVAVFLMRVFQ